MKDDRLISLNSAINEIKAVFEWHDVVTEDRLIQHFKALPSAQPTDAEIQRMQDIEQAALEKAYECGKQDAMQWIPCKTAFPEKENTRVTYQTNAGVIIIDGIYGGIDAYGHRVWLDRERGLYWDDEVVAWMPIVIPEPWKGDTP